MHFPISQFLISLKDLIDGPIKSFRAQEIPYLLLGLKPPRFITAKTVKAEREMVMWIDGEAMPVSSLRVNGREVEAAREAPMPIRAQVSEARKLLAQLFERPKVQTLKAWIECEFKHCSDVGISKLLSAALSSRTIRPLISEVWFGLTQQFIDGTRRPARSTPKMMRAKQECLAVAAKCLKANPHTTITEMQESPEVAEIFERVGEPQPYGRTFYTELFKSLPFRHEPGRPRRVEK